MTAVGLLLADELRAGADRLRAANNAFAQAHPGESVRRQPVHTVYGGAHLFRSDSAAKLGAVALRTLEQYAPDFTEFARVIGLAGADRLPANPRETAALGRRIELCGDSLRGHGRELLEAHLLFEPCALIAPEAVDLSQQLAQHPHLAPARFFRQILCGRWPLGEHPREAADLVQDALAQHAVERRSLRRICGVEAHQWRAG